MNVCFGFGLNVWRILTTLQNSPSPLHHIAWSLARPGSNSRPSLLLWWYTCWPTPVFTTVLWLQYALCALITYAITSLWIQSPLSVHIIISTNNSHIFRSKKRLAFEWCLNYVDQLWIFYLNKLKIYLKNKNAGCCGLLLPVGDFQPSKN